jgi:hypothetical protein
MVWLFTPHHTYQEVPLVSTLPRARGRLISEFSARSMRSNAGEEMPQPPPSSWVQQTLCWVRAWLCPWAQIRRYWQTWSHAPPPPELQELLAHVEHSRPLDAPT